MHSMRNTITELHAMIKLHEKGIPKKVETPVVFYIKGGRIHKDKKKPQGVRGKDKGKTKLAYASKAKISLLPKRDNPTKNSIYYHCKEVGHLRRNCPSYHPELKRRKNASVASTSGYGTHICNTSQGLRESRKLKHEALSLYVGNGMRAAVEAIGSFDLVLPNGRGSRSSVLEPVHLRNFGSMRKWELENSQNNAIAKLPMLQTRRVRDVEIRIIAVLSEDLDYELWGGKRKWLQSLLVGVVTPPEDLNVKILRSLPSEWDTHVVVWMNKPDFDTMGLDDLYNNFKIIKQKVKKSTGAVNDEKNLAFLTTSGASIFSDATVFAFVVYSTTKGPQLVHEDLEQLHDDDLEEIDLKWNMALLSMRARKFYQRTGRKIIIDGSSTAGYDKSKIGVVIDWSDMAEKEIQANIGFHHSQIQSFNSGEDFDHHSDTAVPKPYGSEEHLNEDWP
ncbi:zinc finger, CCHC-type containing protein [Tanacetum coccineum]